MNIIFFSLIVFTLFFGILEGKNLIHHKDWKSFGTALLILIIAIAYGIDLGLDSQALPDPAKFLQIFDPIANTFMDFFQIRL